MFGKPYFAAMTEFHSTYIVNYELSGSHWIITNHYVNSSLLNWKQYRFVSEETKQKNLTKRLKIVFFGENVVLVLVSE